MVYSSAILTPLVAALLASEIPLALAHRASGHSNRLRTDATDVPVTVPISAPSSSVPVARNLVSLSIEGKSQTSHCANLIVNLV